jgi:hypothetical protein
MYFQAQDMIDLAISIIYMNSFGEKISFNKDDFLAVQSIVDWDSQRPDFGACKPMMLRNDVPERRTGENWLVDVNREGILPLVVVLDVSGYGVC